MGTSGGSIALALPTIPCPELPGLLVCQQAGIDHFMNVAAAQRQVTGLNSFVLRLDSGSSNSDEFNKIRAYILRALHRTMMRRMRK